MTNIKILATTLLAVCVLATGSIAQQSKVIRGNKSQANQSQGQCQGKGQCKMNQLGLSQDQKTQIQSIVKKFHEDVKGIRQSNATKEEKKNQITALRESAAGAINAILTPEQQAKANQTGLIDKILGTHPLMQKMLEIFSQLNLTDAQKAQIQTIMQSTREKVKAVREDSSLTPDAKKTQITALRKDSRQQINALLTPEQQQKLKDLIGKQRPKGPSDK